MKTRTKGFIVSFILVFAMLIGVFTIMPMTASAAGGSEPAVANTGLKEITEIKIDFRTFPTTESPRVMNRDVSEYKIISVTYSDGSIETNSAHLGYLIHADFPIAPGGWDEDGMWYDCWVDNELMPTSEGDAIIKRVGADPEYSWVRQFSFHIRDWKDHQVKFADNVIINVVSFSSNIKYATEVGTSGLNSEKNIPNTCLSIDIVAKPLIPIEKVELEIPYVAHGGTLGAPVVKTPNVELKNYNWDSDILDKDNNSLLTALLHPAEGYCFYTEASQQYPEKKITKVYINGDRVNVYHQTTVEQTYARAEYYYNDKISNVDITLDKLAIGAPLGTPTTTTPNVTIKGYSWTPNRTPEGSEKYTLTVLINPNDTYKFTDFCNITVNGQQPTDVSGDEWYRRVEFTFIVTEPIPSANINVGTPVAGQTPADVKGTLTTEGLRIVRETWYEVNSSSLRAMTQDEQFVAGKQYKYEAYVASESGYALASDFFLKINGSFASGNGGLWKMRTPITAKTAFSASTVNNSATIAFNGSAKFVVNATGERLLYSWKAVEDGAPQITSATNTDTLVVYGNTAGTWHYTCTVWEQNNGDVNSKTITVTLTVEEKVSTPKDFFTPAHPEPVGTGFAGVGDINNVTVIQGESIVLKPTFTFGKDPADLWHGGKTPVTGTLSYEWQLWVNDPVNGVIIKDLGTGDTLVIDKNLHETYNTGNICSFTIMVTITNTAMIGDESLTSSNWTGVTVNVVEPDATGNLGGNISSGQARTYSMRSSGSLEGTIVYLVKDEVIVFATEANANGDYLFTSIPYGSYNVKVDKEGYEEYNKPVEVNAAEVTHDVTIILHVCFADEGNEMSIPARQPNCEMGELGNIECRACISCGKFYDMDGNLIADSANDPYSLNDMGIPYAALLYPVHDYCGEAQEGGNADQYLRHRAENCLEETTYWYYCINGNCKKSAGDDPMAVDKYYVGSASNQTHSYTSEIADEYYFYQGGTNCCDKIWYYHACEYCYAKGNTVWESNEYGNHAYGAKIPAQPEVHTDTELKAGVAAHYFCDVCDTYFDEAYIETTLAMLTGAKPEHSYTNVNGYKGADGHANTCSCGAKDTVVGHTPNMENPTETEDKKCTLCGYIIENKTGHKHTNNLTKVGAKGASCTVDGNIEYYTCSCGKWFTDATATTEITNKDSVVIKAAHIYGDLIVQDNGTHTATELKDGMKAHYFCDVCDTYFDSGKNATTKAALTITNAHSYTTEYGYKGADGHANTCACGAKDTVVGHTHGAAATETEPQKCTVCQYIIADALGHQHVNHLTKVGANSASCTVDGNIEYYTCSCGKWFADATATTEITNKDSVKVQASHTYGDLIALDNGTHTATELKDGMKAHYFCDVCDTYFDSGKNATTKAALTITNAHSYATEYGYKGADGHANTCACGAKDTVEGHTPDRESATETHPVKCTKCQYVIATELGHVHTSHLTKVSANSASCTADGNIEYYTCSCGKWFTDATATTEITNKDSVVIKAAHDFSNLILAQDAVHTATELKGAVAAHYHCSCGAYFNEGKEATTLEALTGAVPTHTFVEGACECGATDPNYVPPHEHTFVEGKCECGETDPNYVPPHEHTFVEGKCECGETDPNYTPETNDPGTDVPGTDTPSTDEGGLGTGAIVAIVVGSVLVVGVGGFALVWFVIKKKTWAQFLAIFKKG